MNPDFCSTSPKKMKQITFVQDIVGELSAVHPRNAMIPQHQGTRHHGEFSKRSLKQSQDFECFCGSTTPVFLLARLIGISLISTNHENNVSKVSNAESGKEQIHSGPHPPPHHHHYCHSVSLLSLPSVTNALLTITYVYLTIWIYQHLGEHLGLFFHGVDYYTLAVDVVTNFIATTLLLIHARLKGSVLLKAMHELQNTYSVLKTHNPKFSLSRNVKLMAYFLVGFISLVTLIYGSLFLFLIFAKTVPFTDTAHKEEWLTFPFVLQKLGHFFMPLYSQSFVALFIICTEVVRQLYMELARKLSRVLQNASNYNNGIETLTVVSSETTVADEIESSRLLYEELMKIVGILSKYFGGSLLVICSVAVLSVTAAIYTIILNRAGVDFVTNRRHQDIIGYFFVVWGFHLFFAFFILGGVLISGQRVTCASQRISRVLQENRMNCIDRNAKFQISLLAQAVYGEPVEISACSITKMSMSFVASAVGNIITYILVLLQFRWSCSAKGDG